MSQNSAAERRDVYRLFTGKWIISYPGCYDSLMRLGDLKERGAVLLISCYELGHQPFGLAMPMAFLGRVGFQPAAMDMSVEGFDEERIEQAKFIGISVPMHTALRLGVRVASRARLLNPHSHICFFGLYATINAEYLLEHVADSVLGGEFEEPLVNFLLALHEGKEGDLPGIGRPGVPALPHLRRLQFPVPQRSGLPALEQYARLLEGEHQYMTGYVEASRGCKHLCLHCPIPPVYGGRFFAIPMEVVLADIRQLVSFGARHITFGDPDFLNGPGHSLKIVRAMHAEFPDTTFDFTAKVEHLLRHKGVLEQFAMLGCKFIVSAVESLSDTVLANLDKGHTRAEAIRVFTIVREAGLTLRPSFVSFTPWTTLEDYLEVLEFVESEGLVDHVDPVQYTIRLLVPPGSFLIKSRAMQPFLDKLIPDLFTYSWRHPDHRMDLLHLEVSKCVEKAIEKGDDNFLAFLRVKELAVSIRENRPAADVISFELSASRVSPPRLTEAWFC